RLASSVKLPARLRTCSASSPADSTKNPSPLILKSVGRFVVIALPAVCIVSIDAKLTPRPTCFALTPPLTPSSGAVTPLTVWLKISENITRQYLKPIVLTFAILLPITSSFVWKPLIPETPEYIDLSMIHPPNIRYLLAASVGQQL